ncbi:MAG: response regulator [Bacteroidota bacterium]
MEKPSTILLVDDDETTNFYNELLIRQHFPKLEVAIVTNGQKALNYLQKHPYPKIILLDINMPVMDGFEFLEIYQQQNHSDPPLIAMLTTSLNPDDIKLADAYPQIKKFLSKPLQITDLKALLESIKSK